MEAETSDLTEGETGALCAAHCARFDVLIRFDAFESTRNAW